MLRNYQSLVSLELGEKWLWGRVRWGNRRKALKKGGIHKSFAEAVRSLDSQLDENSKLSLPHTRRNLGRLQEQLSFQNANSQTSVLQQKTGRFFLGILSNPEEHWVYYSLLLGLPSLSRLTSRFKSILSKMKTSHLKKNNDFNFLMFFIIIFNT